MPTAHRASPTSPSSTAVFATRRLRPTTAIVTAHGEIDAANAAEFFAFAASHSGPMNYLVLDLTGVEFFGTAGFSALHRLAARCAADAVEWALVPSPAVNRLLFICDPESSLPVQPTLEAALDEPPRLLQLVAESR